MLSHPIQQKSEYERLEARISSEKKNLLKYAADLLGKSLTDFVINSSYDFAVRVIQEHEQLRLSLKDRHIFIAALVNSPKPSKNLVAATQSYRKKVMAK